jgi:acetyl-CoA C-acetyltransferase
VSLDARAPVLVGVGSAVQREADPARALEPVALMHLALERAAEDAGSRALLARADSVRAPRGFWDYADPCRTLARAFGAKARTWVAEIGVLQTTLLRGAAEDVAAGRADVVLVAGGEARHRAQQARRAGVGAPLTRDGEAEADVVLRPEAAILLPAEITTGLATPVREYAMIETALRAADAQPVAEHAREVAGLWAGMSDVAATNPDAWQPEPVGADAILAGDLLAHPYGKRHTSQWNVDQAAGAIVCSVATARALGLPESRWIHPWGVVESNHMVPLPLRRELHRSPGFHLAGERLAEATGVALDAAKHRELYSCFPSAVRVQLRELGLDASRPLTVSGGMAFAGGPLNSFVLQALVPLARRLREDRGSHGLLTAISGIVTKQGVSLWSSEPPPRPFVGADVGPEVAASHEPMPFDGEAPGEGTVRGYTVIDEGTGALRTAALCDRADGTRTIATSTDPGLARTGLAEELVGRELVAGDDGPRLA